MAGKTADWRVQGAHYFAYKYFLRKQFGVRVQRISLDGRMTCPNVDGTVARGGCVFCDNRSFSPSRRVSGGAISDQIEGAIRRLSVRYPDCDRYIAYFQPGTNTYADVDHLRELYESALGHPSIVGLAVGTRPDCVDSSILDLLSELAGRSFVSVEYGMQTVHDRSLEWMNRGHRHRATVDAVERSRGRGFEIAAHLMIGLPGETRHDMLETAREAARLGFDAVKLHNLYVVEDTPLADQYRQGTLTLLDRNQYVQSVVDTLEVLAPDTVIQRLGGEAPGEYFVAPSWCLDKVDVRRAIDDELRKRGSVQGSKYRPNQRT